MWRHQLESLEVVVKLMEVYVEAGFLQSECHPTRKRKGEEVCYQCGDKGHTQKNCLYMDCKFMEFCVWTGVKVGLGYR